MIPVTAQSFDALHAAYWLPVSPKALLHGTRPYPSVMMRHKSLLSENQHSVVWRRLWQFWCDMQKTQQHVLPAKIRCGGRTLVSIRLYAFLGQSVSPPWNTPPAFTAHWSSALDNLVDRLTSVKSVEYYISPGPVTSSYSMAISGWHGMPVSIFFTSVASNTHRT